MNMMGSFDGFLGSDGTFGFIDGMRILPTKTIGGKLQPVTQNICLDWSCAYSILKRRLLDSIGNNNETML